MKIILYICSANKDRSKTAEDYFSERFPDMHFDSAGTNKTICHQLGTHYITQTQLNDADIIFVMEQKHAEAIKNRFGNQYFSKIKVLHIKDMYKYDSKELIEVLNSRIPNPRETRI